MYWVSALVPQYSCEHQVDKHIYTEKAREARQLGPETICEFLRESRANAVEGGRSRPRRLDTDMPTSAWEASMETPRVFGQHEPSQEHLIPVASWPAGTGTGLGIEDNDSEIELHLLREDRTGAGENVIRLEPWVNQVRAHLADLARC